MLAAASLPRLPLSNAAKVACVQLKKSPHAKKGQKGNKTPPAFFHLLNLFLLFLAHAYEKKVL